MARTRSAALLGLLIATLLVCSPARAAVVFSNLGPGDTFDTNFTWLIGGSVNNIDIAGTFVVGGSAFAFNSAELVVRHQSGPNSYSVFLLSDVGGAPGAILETIPLTGIPGTATLVLADASDSVILAPNTTYWLALDATSPTSGGWFFNSTGDTGVASRTANGPWSVSPGLTAPAFRINGTPAGVPEPMTLALIGLGLAVVGIAFRRKK
jgi:hypothetical protein